MRSKDADARDNGGAGGPKTWSSSAVSRRTKLAAAIAPHAQSMNAYEAHLSRKACPIKMLVL